MNHYNTRSVVSNQKDLPENIRDDPSVNETLTLISEQDFNRFAYASDERRCHSADQILRGNMRYVFIVSIDRRLRSTFRLLETDAIY